MQEMSVAGGTRPALRSLDSWIDAVGVTRSTVWRWRRDGKLETVNIAGRVYVTDEAIADFVKRAEAGEFAQHHVAPKRTAIKGVA
jgi:hypothetical protein